VDASGLAEGSVTATATAKDLAGNTSSSFAAGVVATKDTVAPSAPSTNTLLLTYTRNPGSTPDGLSALAGFMASAGDYVRVAETSPHAGSSYIGGPGTVLLSLPATSVDAIASGSVTYVIYELDPAGNQSATGTTYTQPSG
jgi:predicted RecA/RadA family phage recombinase